MFIQKMTLFTAILLFKDLELFQKARF